MKLSLVGTTSSNSNWTALHWACARNREECVRLFLAHPQCTTDIVRTVGSDGKTAEMVANYRGYHGCAWLVRDYVNNSRAPSSSAGAFSTVNPSHSSSPAVRAPPPPYTRQPPPSAPPCRLSLAQLGAAIDDIEIEKQTFLEETTTKISSIQQKLDSLQ